MRSSLLRVGLTGSLGSGKSTAAELLRQHGAHILNADDIGRQLMQPGQPVYDKIVARFGPDILLPDGNAGQESGRPELRPLDRPAIASLVFNDEAALADLNAIVHPATIARQAELAAQISDPHAVVVVESALIFETPHAGPLGWRSRFDRVILVTAPEPLRIARFVARINPHPTPTEQASLEAEARRRLARQMPEEQKLHLADVVLYNDSTLAHLQAQVDALWPKLQQAARAS